MASGRDRMTQYEHLLTRVIYDELTNLAMGRGLVLGGSYHNEATDLWTIEVSGTLDLSALARRIASLKRTAP